MRSSSSACTSCKLRTPANCRRVHEIIVAMVQTRLWTVTYEAHKQGYVLEEYVFWQNGTDGIRMFMFAVMVKQVVACGVHCSVCSLRVYSWCVALVVVMFVSEITPMPLSPRPVSPKPIFPRKAVIDKNRST